MEYKTHTDSIKYVCGSYGGLVPELSKGRSVGEAYRGPTWSSASTIFLLPSTALGCCVCEEPVADPRPHCLCLLP